MGALFLTGFPGFIGKRLVNALHQRFNFDKIYLLVEPSMLKKAEWEVKKLPARDRIELIEGDITAQNLKLDPVKFREIKPRITHLFHLAAIYDLTVEFEKAYRVNVEGTRNILDFADHLPSLKKLVYFSTAYVSGKRTGTVYEEELDMGQGFKNHYEYTKFLAENEVRERIRDLPVVIIRPGIVIGDSQTGETDKFDGPYYVMIFFKKMPDFLPLPYIGKGDAEVNLVPVDFVVDATVELTSLGKSTGKTYHLTDPDPLTARELYRLFSVKIRGKEPFGEIPLGVVQTLLKIRPIARLFGVPYEATPYFEHQVHYDSSNTLEDLATTGIRVPPLTSYIDRIVKFFLENYKNPDLRKF